MIVEKAKKLERDRAFLRRWRDAAVATGLYRADTDISTPEKWQLAQAAVLASLLSERDDLRKKVAEAEANYKEIARHHNQHCTCLEIY